MRITHVTHELSSDHLCITCQLDLSIPSPPCVPVDKRNLNSIHRDNFHPDISTYIATKPNLSTEQLNEFLCSLVDIHAPAAQTRAPLQKSDPWYCEISDQLRSTERDCSWKAEMRSTSSGHTVHKQMFNTAKKLLTSPVHSARTTYFSTKITERPPANNCLALPASCCLELNLHQYHFHCLLINSLIFIANFSLSQKH